MHNTFIRQVRLFFVYLIVAELVFVLPHPAEASYHFSNYQGTPPIHVLGSSTKSPVGMAPSEIKTIYHLPESGGKGTIVIVDAYNDSTIEADLAAFDKQFGLPECTKANGCLTQHLMSSKESANSGWALETSLDVEWAHAIAPNAKIVLVEATTQSGTNLLSAVDYAAAQKGVVAISMSWGGAEFPEENSLDAHFKSASNAVFFASSGDNGSGASWPASSPNVVSVGGTHISVTSGGTFRSETAWSGSGGGISAYEKEPAFQTAYNIPKANGMRAIPDVSYDADPSSGFPVYTAGKWQEVGGTSAGAPQWAAIAALGSGITLQELYADKASQSNANFFRDIVSGTNGSCGYLCTARKHYDYVTGLGSPLTVTF
jgi:subtilase family serine protease